MSFGNNSWSARLASTLLPEEFAYQRAIWGKAQGARSDFRWLACSAGFVKDDDLERKKLILGSQDAPSELYFWRYLPETSRYYAGKAYPSRATDASGRTGFLEKQLLEWSKASDIPVALAAILLISAVKKWNDEIWWQRRDEIDWSNEGESLVIDVPPLKSPEQHNLGKILDSFISAGLEELNELQTELTHCYARLLAHEKPAVLYASKPLKPESLATLMLPLEAALANNLSIAGWIPSAYPELNKLGENWDIVVLPEANASTLSEQAQQYLPKARLMVEALLQNQPDLLIPKPELVSTMAEEPQMKLAMWGPTSAGKTFLLAQLHLIIHGKASDWDVYPTDGMSPGFIDAMRDALANNFFPKATAVGDSKEIRYEFVHRKSASRALLSVEDRAGKDHESLHDDSMQRMIAACGLVLLIDPMSDSGSRQIALTRLFERMLLARREQNRADRKDPRPIAVCVSKADKLIETMADYEHACKNPDTFIREHSKWQDLLGLLNKYCANYRLFPVSAVGVSPRYGIIEGNTFYDEQLQERVKNKLRPFNLIEPFAWLINELKDAS